MSREMTPEVQAVVEAGDFLLRRLEEFGRDLNDDAGAAHWIGHVEPAMARFRAALNKPVVSRTQAEAGVLAIAVEWAERRVEADQGQPHPTKMYAATCRLLDAVAALHAASGGRWTPPEER